MNQELLQFNKENYIVTNENGQIDFIRTTCGSNNTEIILEKENLLEEYGNELEKCNDDIHKVKNDLKKAKRSKNLTWILFIASLVINLRLFLINNISFLIFGGVVSSFAAIAIVLHDNDLTKIKSNLLSLEQIKKELNVKIPMLEKELKNLKEQVFYKRFNAEIVENRGLDGLQLSEPKISYKKRILRK